MFLYKILPIFSKVLFENHFCFPALMRHHPPAHVIRIRFMTSPRARGITRPGRLARRAARSMLKLQRRAASGRAAELDINLMGSVEGPRPEVENMTDGFSGLAVSPDEKKFAFVARGEIFAGSMEGDAPAARRRRSSRAGWPALRRRSWSTQASWSFLFVSCGSVLFSVSGEPGELRFLVHPPRRGRGALRLLITRLQSDSSCFRTLAFSSTRKISF